RNGHLSRDVRTFDILWIAPKIAATKAPASIAEEVKNILIVCSGACAGAATTSGLSATKKVREYILKSSTTSTTSARGKPCSRRAESAHLIVFGPLRFIGEHTIRFGNAFEFVFCNRISRIRIRMIFTRQLAIRLFNVGL